MQVSLPYGKEKVILDLPEERMGGLLATKLGRMEPRKEARKLIEEAISSPLEGPPLSVLAGGKDRVVIITSDHTRPLPSRITLPPLLEALRKGNPETEITILMATGYHRAPTGRELEDKLGQEIVQGERIIIHSARDREKMVEVGQLPSGQRLELNRIALEADLLLAEGFIEPHLFAGFSGGGKSILPGIAGEASILSNHCAELIADPRARTGIMEGNPVQEEIQAAARLAGLKFISNVALNNNHRVVAAFAGEPEAAHRAGCDFVDRWTRVKCSPGDVVITTNGGYPLDQNIYQAVKGMTAAEAACRKGGTIISLARCSDGHGSEAFFQDLSRAGSPAQLWDEVCSRSREDTCPDQWQAQILARILSRFRVIMVTGASRELVEQMHMEWAPSLEKALEMVDSRDRITVIPDGVGVIVDADC